MGFLQDDPPVEESKPEIEEKGEDRISLDEGMDFSKDELKEIVGKYKDVEKTHGGVDKLLDEWGKQSNEIGSLRKQLGEIQTELVQRERVKEDPNQVGPEQILAEAEKQGLITQRNLQNFMLEWSAGQKLAEEAMDYQTKGNPYGAKELPNFEAKGMIEWMKANGVNNPKTAYQIRYEREIDSWKSKTLSQGRPSGMVTEEASSSPGQKQPKPVAITRANLSEMVRASLNREL